MAHIPVGSFTMGSTDEQILPDPSRLLGSFPEGVCGVGGQDMAGKAWEWVAEWEISFYPSGLQVNPTGPESGSEKNVRGGSWENHHKEVRAANCGTCRPILRSCYIGFRCVITQL